MNETIYHSETDSLAQLLVGRKVVNVADDILTLDNGTLLQVEANEGCGGCSSGWFELTELNTCDNVITSVTVDSREEGYDDVYSLFVYAENTQIKLIEATGSVGNGYYGAGYRINVILRKE